MRQAITNFAASVTPEGLPQSRFPSHQPQLIAGFSLIWILQVCDHYLFFGDTRFARSFIPRIDGVLDFFDAHVDNLGLISGLPETVWQYVDWVTTWGATESHPDKGVPTSGRASNRHTYFSMLYAYVLQAAARFVREVGRQGHADEYEGRAQALIFAIREHCYDGFFFTDSTADVAAEDAYSQHCQVFAILSGAANPDTHVRILRTSLTSPQFAKCSYMMRFYALRALSQVDAASPTEGLYDSLWDRTWEPYRKMLDNNLSTWEEDDVRQRSDCHAWGSVPIYEFCTELAGVKPVAPGCRRILWTPRVRLSGKIKARVALGRENLVCVEWAPGDVEEGVLEVRLQLDKPVEVVSRLPGGESVEHGVVDFLQLSYELEAA